MAAPRAYWKGSLKLSLVSCPVALYPALTSVEKTRFHMINKETGNRLKQQMIDSETGDVVGSDQKGRGYELKKGEYIEVEKAELEAVQIESNHTIDIDSFVPSEEIDKRFLDHPYYIVPGRQSRGRRLRGHPRCHEGQGPYCIGADRADQPRACHRHRGRSARVCSAPPCTIPMSCATRTIISTISRARRSRKDMIELASHILDTKAAHFDPSKFKDEYEIALKSLVRRKASGKTIKVAEREKTSRTTSSI